MAIIEIARAAPYPNRSDQFIDADEALARLDIISRTLHPSGIFIATAFLPSVAVVNRVGERCAQ